MLLVAAPARHLLAVVTVGAIVGAAREAGAVERHVVVASPGYVYADAGTATAHGFELGAHWLRAGTPLGFGAFGQVQRYSDRSVRLAGGAQATVSVLGLELGYAHRGEGERSIGPILTTVGHTSGVHVAPFVSLGFVYVAYRWTIPVERGAPPAHGAERAFTVGVKVPIPVDGDLLRGLEGVLAPLGH